MKICLNCGIKNSDSRTKCEECGGNLRQLEPWENPAEKEDKSAIKSVVVFAAIALVVSVYLIMFKSLNTWQNNLATMVCVISLPVLFYSIFTQLAFKKYGDMQKKDERQWDKEEQEDIDKNEKAP